MNAAHELETRALTWPEQAKAVAVTDQESFDRAGEMLRGIKTLRGEIDATFNPIIAKAHEAHREACAQKKRVETPLVEAETTLKGAIGTYLEAEERARRQREAELAEEARRAEETARLEEAAKWEQAGEPETAAAVLEQPAVATAISLPKARAEGISSREIWEWRITDEKRVPREFLCIDTVKVNGVVRALKGATNIAGIQVTKRTGIAARRA